MADVVVVEVAVAAEAEDSMAIGEADVTVDGVAEAG